LYPSPFIDGVKVILGLLWSIIDIFQLKQTWNLCVLKSPKLMHVILFFMKCPLQLVLIVVLLKDNLIHEFICLLLHNQLKILMGSFNRNQLIQSLIFKFYNMFCSSWIINWSWLFFTIELNISFSSEFNSNSKLPLDWFSS
jgi:hypothetical protein